MIYKAGKVVNDVVRGTWSNLVIEGNMVIIGLPAEEMAAPKPHEPAFIRNVDHIMADYLSRQWQTVSQTRRELPTHQAIRQLNNHLQMV